MYWENEYNPRVAVPDAERYFDAWTRRAASARQGLQNAAEDVPYGSHPRERLDVFHAESSRGTLVFLHGGYWRAFGRESQSWIAEPFVREGITVAIPSYPLAPQARLAQIITSLCGALSVVQRKANSGERRRLVVSGHSAGAHLAACLLALPERQLHGPSIDAIVCVSGIFDLMPILHTRMLAGMGWSPAELHAVSPLFMSAPARGEVVLAVGGDESGEFQMQTARMAHAWADRVKTVLRPEGRHHFSVVEDLGDARSELFREVIGLF